MVRASFLEIYNEEIRDLLSKDPKEKCDLKEGQSGVYVKDLSAFVVKSVSEMQQVLEAGLRNRSTGATLMNTESSRSHSIFTITVPKTPKNTLKTPKSRNFKGETCVLGRNSGCGRRRGRQPYSCNLGKRAKNTQNLGLKLDFFGFFGSKNVNFKGKVWALGCFLVCSFLGGKVKYGRFGRK